MAAGGDAAHRVEWRGALVDGDIESFLAEISSILRDQEHRGGTFQPPVERQSQRRGLSLRGCDVDRCDIDECDNKKCDNGKYADKCDAGKRNRRQRGGSTVPKNMAQGRHACLCLPLTLSSPPRSA